MILKLVQLLKSSNHSHYETQCINVANTSANCIQMAFRNNKRPTKLRIPNDKNLLFITV